MKSIRLVPILVAFLMFRYMDSIRLPLRQQAVIVTFMAVFAVASCIVETR